jgi:ferredoxin-type protein NapH
MENQNKPQKNNPKYFNKIRFGVLTISFLIILINPFLNYYLHISFIQGWYQSLAVGKLWFVSPLEGIESLLVSKQFFLPSVIGMLPPVLLALFMGRVFCSWMCPISFLSELSDKTWNFFSKKKRKDLIILPKNLLWFSLIGELIFAMILAAPLFVFLSPPGLVGREIMLAVFFKTLAVEGIIVLIVLFLNLITRRFFCRYFCPLGGLLAFLGRKRELKIIKDDEKCINCGLCDKSCPMGLMPSKGEGKGLYCWNCGKCVDSCNNGAIKMNFNK